MTWKVCECTQLALAEKRQEFSRCEGVIGVDLRNIAYPDCQVPERQLDIRMCTVFSQFVFSPRRARQTGSAARAVRSFL